MAKIVEATHESLPIFIDRGLGGLKEVERQEASGERVARRIAKIMVFGVFKRDLALSCLHSEIKKDPHNVSLRFLEAWLRKDVQQCERFFDAAKRAHYWRTIKDMKSKIEDLTRESMFVQLRALVGRHFARNKRIHGHPAP